MLPAVGVLVHTYVGSWLSRRVRSKRGYLKYQLGLEKNQGTLPCPIQRSLGSTVARCCHPVQVLRILGQLQRADHKRSNSPNRRGAAC